MRNVDMEMASVAITSSLSSYGALDPDGVTNIAKKN